MRAARKMLSVFVCMLFCAVAATAQQQEVTIIIEAQQVRFIPQKAIAEMRLQVFDQTGETVYDSGASVEPQINWSLRGAGGDSVKSGLYAYTLSIKEAGAVSDTAGTRIRRGHLIVDRVKDRDGKPDRLWVTSQNEGGVGADLTVARNEDATIAGANIAGERTVGNDRSGLSRDSSSREVATETPGKPDTSKLDASKTTSAATTAGTVGRIAKFISTTEVGDSSISESVNGVQLPNGVQLGAGAQGNNVAFGSPNGETGMTISGATGRSDIRFDGTTLRLLAGPAGGPPSNGIGITSSNVQLPNNVSLGVGAQGNNVAFGSPNSETGMSISGAGGRADLRFNGTLKLLNGPGGIPPQTNGIAITTAGNVGIGRVDPVTKLHVESPGVAEVLIKSNTDRAVLALSNGLNTQGYVWTLESGIFGQFPSLFGIYNRNVNKAGLTIDGNLLVSVKALQITGGADFAENFDVRVEHFKGRASVAEIQPGMVVAIDLLNPGKLSLSRRAYDYRVAGIISGAGDVKPGMMMGQAGTLADGKHPVALSGRVYAWVDATHSAIRPGDLLTTSTTPGHAMKVGNSGRAQGAIIGKAMTGLKSGKGLVLVLVTLQ